MSVSHHIPAGKLTRTIEIQCAAETTDDAGASVFVWSKLAKVKAELVEQATSDEQMPGYGRLTREMLLFRLRYIAGITLNDRVVYDGNNFRIVKLAEIGIRRGLELTVERNDK